MTVTAADQATTSSYTVTVAPSEGALPATAAGMELDGLDLDFDPGRNRYSTTAPPGLRSTEITVRTAPGTTAETTAYQPPGTTPPSTTTRGWQGALDQSTTNDPTSATRSTTTGGTTGAPTSQDGTGTITVASDRDTLIVTTVSTPDHERESVYTTRLRPPPRSATRSTGTEPRLTALSVSPGSLDPAFAATTHVYGVDVAHDVSQVTVAATAATGARATVVAPDADPDTAGHQVDLNVPEEGKSSQTAIVVVVTAGTRIDSYTVTVTRAAASRVGLRNTDASLSGLTLSTGVLSPAFAAGTTSYTAAVGHNTAQVTIDAQSTDSGADVDITPDDADTTAGGHQVDLSSDTTAVTVEVTAADGTTTRTYTVRVHRTIAADNASLAVLSLSPGTLSPALADATTLYTASYASTVKTVTVTAAPAHSNATMLIGPGDADTTTDGHQVKLRNGDNPVTIRVVSPDGTNTRTYVVTLTRAAPSNPASATLNALSANVGTAISFRSDTEWYWVSDIGATATRATISWTPTDNNADITVTPADADTSTAGHQVDIGNPNTNVTITVEASDGATERTYTIALYRDERWVDIDAGRSHFCGLRSNGRAHCWGEQVHNSVSRAVTSPPAANIYRDVYAGQAHSCGTLTDGTFHCWTSDQHSSHVTGGETGIVHMDTHVISRRAANCWLDEDARVRCAGPTAVPPEVRAGRQLMISNGLSLHCAVDIVGGMACWDADNALPVPPARLGTGLVEATLICEIDGLTGGGVCRRDPARPPVEGGPPTLYRSVSVTDDTACGIRTDGSIRCWRYEVARTWPWSVNPRSYGDFRFVIVDDDRDYLEAAENFSTPTCVLATDGDVRCRQGLVREGDYTTLAMREGGDTCAITTAGTIDCWNLRRGHGSGPMGDLDPASNSWPPLGVAEIRIGSDRFILPRSGIGYPLAVPAAATTVDVAVQNLPSGHTALIAPADSDTNAEGHQVRLVTDTNLIVLAVKSTSPDRTELYTFGDDLPAAGDLPLSELTISGVNMTAFDSGTTSYSRLVAADVSTVTVDAASPIPGATFAITPGDADSTADGHQVTLDSDGRTTVRVAVSMSSTVVGAYEVELVRLDGSTSPLSSDVSLSSVHLGGADLSADAPGSSRYRYAPSLSDYRNDAQATLEVTTANGGAAWTVVAPQDADSIASGHQVRIRDLPTVEIEVTAQDGLSTRRYVVEPSSAFSDQIDDCALCAPDSLGTTRGGLSYADGEYVTIDELTVKAFDASTGAKLREFDISGGDDFDAVQTFWTDGDDLWVIFDTGSAYSYTDRTFKHYIRSYSADSGSARGKRIQLPSSEQLDSPYVAMWGDGTSLYVADTSGVLRIFNARSGDQTGTITLQGVDWNNSSRSMWADGSTMWIADCSSIKAFDMATGTRLEAFDVPTSRCGGLWSDSRSLWTAHGGKLVGYVMAEHARLSYLKIGSSSKPFHSGILERSYYTRANLVTVQARAAFTGGASSIDYSEPDGSSLAGYQVRLPKGRTTLTITVTAPNGTDTETYSVHFIRS